MQFLYGGARGKQTRGVMIGSGLGGALFRLVFIVHEMCASLPENMQCVTATCPDAVIRAVRFVDDLRIFVFAPLHVGDHVMRQLAASFLERTYPAHLPLKDDAVNPFVGLNIFIDDGDLCWSAHNKSLANFACYGLPGKQQLQPYFSFQPSAVRDAVVIGGFARCRALSSCWKWLVWSLSGWCDALIVQAKFPTFLVSKLLKAWCARSLPPHGIKTADAVMKCLGRCPQHGSNVYNESLSEARVLFVAGSLCLTTL
jgi:hypothetical protein